jgi:hypothetical protein
MRIGIQTWGTEGGVRPCFALAGGPCSTGRAWHRGLSTGGLPPP